MLTTIHHTERLHWYSDIHLEFARGNSLERFLKSISELDNPILITGDLSAGDAFEYHLLMLGKRVRQHLYFVMGNHDFYHSSFEATENAAARVCSANPRMTRLDGTQIVQLSRDVSMVGVDGWADGRAGIGIRTGVRINDFPMIADFKKLGSKRSQFDLMLERAQTEAAALGKALEAAVLGECSVIIIATHVPVWQEAAWHMGKSSDNDYAPFFCSPTIGDVIMAQAAKFPQKRFLVLCGHTHGEGTSIRGNVTVLTAASEYGSPQKTLSLDLAEIARGEFPRLEYTAASHAKRTQKM